MASVTVCSELGEIRIPVGLSTLAAFRRWTYTDEFREIQKIARIDFIKGDICVEVREAKLEKCDFSASPPLAKEKMRKYVMPLKRTKTGGTFL